MELVNDVNKLINSVKDPGEACWSVVREALESTIVLLSPVVPHITEELWHTLGHEESLLTVPWPSVREEALEVDSRLIVLQVNGKVRARVDVPVSLNEEGLKNMALENERIKQFIGDKPVKKIILVKNRLVNVVV
jgi:leucyl-tRNA synthetase